MKVHEFTIVASGLHPETTDLANAFYEAGCDDATIAFQKGVIILEFARDSSSFSHALLSAVEDVLKTGARVDRIEPDYLVSLSDIARRADISRAAVSLYVKGARGAGFPPPVARVTTESPLWDWVQVAHWFHKNDRIGREQVVEAKVVREANIAVLSHREPAHFAKHMQQRLDELESA